MEQEKELSPAERLYKNHLLNVAKYQKNNVEKCREKCRKYNDSIKNDPEKYQQLLQKKREYYNNITKPKLQKKKEELKNICLFDFVKE